MLVQQGLAKDPFSGAVYAFRGRRAGLIKLLWHDGVGLCLLTKRLEQGQSLGRRPRRRDASPCPRRSWRRCSMAASGALRCRAAGRNWPGNSAAIRSETVGPTRRPSASYGRADRTRHAAR
ncbi:IS66 family insertion sequence element accessory protein TnpB [Siccirubricoccus deserti]